MLYDKQERVVCTHGTEVSMHALHALLGLIT